MSVPKVRQLEELGDNAAETGVYVALTVSRARDRNVLL